MMKKLVTLTIIAAFIGGVGIMASATTADAHVKNEVCHKGEIICVPAATAIKHRDRHGDTIGRVDPHPAHSCTNEGLSC